MKGRFVSAPLELYATHSARVFNSSLCVSVVERILVLKVVYASIAGMVCRGGQINRTGGMPPLSNRRRIIVTAFFAEKPPNQRVLVIAPS